MLVVKASVVIYYNNYIIVIKLQLCLELRGEGSIVIVVIT